MQQSVNRKHTHTHTRTSKVGDTPAVKLTSPQSGHQLSTMTSLPPMTSATQAKGKTKRERQKMATNFHQPLQFELARVGKSRPRTGQLN